MISILDSYDISMGFLWDSYRISMTWDLYGFSMVFYWIYMILLWDLNKVPMGFPWCFYDISMGLL